MTLQFINIVLHGDKRKAGTESDYAQPDVDYAYDGQQNHQKHIFQLEAGDKHRYVNAYRSAEQSRKYQLAVPGIQLAFVRHILVALRKQEHNRIYVYRDYICGENNIQKYHILVVCRKNKLLLRRLLWQK